LNVAGSGVTNLELISFTTFIKVMTEPWLPLTILLSDCTRWACDGFTATAVQSHRRMKEQELEKELFYFGDDHFFCLKLLNHGK
jgi:nicotinamide riboside kinase